MLRAIEHHPAACWPAEHGIDSLTLAYDDRHRRRIRLTTDGGADVLLDLPKAVAMAHGDGLKLEDGRWIAVRAAPEAVVEVRSADATQLARIAWHIGNRHFPAQILRGAIRIRPDHVMEAMIAGLGGALTRLEAPFQPEGGAYGGGRETPGPAAAHSHDHAAGHHHDHAHHGGHGHHHSHSHDH
jgi:urease accessory protein